MVLKQLLILLISCSLLACASTSEQAEGSSGEDTAKRSDCIHEPSIRGYTVLDEQNLLVEAGGRRDYHVVLQRRAYGLRHSRGIVFEATTSRVCAGFDGIRFEGDMRDLIRISSIAELTKEEKDHLLIRFGKKEPEIEQTPAPQEVEGADVEELDKGASE